VLLAQVELIQQCLGQQVPQALLVPQGRQAHKVQVVPLVLQVQSAQQVPQAHKVFKVIKVWLALQARLAQQVQLVQVGPQAQQVPIAQYLALRERQAPLVQAVP
jgi:hypothetical protein